MKKKHRDIVVDGVQYGWMVEWFCGYHQVRIWKDKKVIATFDIEHHHDNITPGIIAELIKDPVGTLAYLNAEPCPFCGSLVGKAAGSYEEKFFVCRHEEDCWLFPTSTLNLIPKDEIDKWNKRH